MSDVVDASPPEAAAPQPSEDTPTVPPGEDAPTALPSGDTPTVQPGGDTPTVQPGGDNVPPGGNDTRPPGNARLQGPQRFRSLIVGLVVAGLLAILLFVVLRPEKESVNPALGVGDTAPTFSLPRLGGGVPVNLDALGVDRHKPVVLNFFASWCIPCQEETPMLGQAATAAKAAGSPVQFIGVDVNDPSSNALNFVRQSGVTYPVGSDRTLKVTSVDYALNAQPNTFFIDGSGKIIGQKQGALTQAELAQWMRRLTGGGS